MHRISLRAAAVCTALVLSPALALLAAPEARAGVIFQQTVPLIFGGASSDLSLPVAAADDFQLQPGASTLTGIQWWGAL